MISTSYLVRTIDFHYAFKEPDKKMSIVGTEAESGDHVVGLEPVNHLFIVAIPDANHSIKATSYTEFFDLQEVIF